MPSPFDRIPELGRLASGASPAGHGLREALRWGAHHSGLPVIVVAALSLVISYRLAKRAARLAVEVVVAAAVLLVATRMGWLTW